MAMKLLKKILRVPYRVSVKIAKKITNFDYVFQHNKELEKDIENLNNGLIESNQKLQIYEEEYNWGHPKGHYYSPVHSKEDLTDYSTVKKREINKFRDVIPGFSDEKMLDFYKILTKYFNNYDYPEFDNLESRFFIKNNSYPVTDSLILFSMLMHFKPKQIIEIGSGMTSALMMDVNERFLNNSMQLTFIEPYPDLLYSRMKEKDKKMYKVIKKKVQEVPLKEFSRLEAGDFLFIDSTHVSKFNSDVNYEIFDILPMIKSGVFIHFHDVFDGFVYPLEWLNLGWAWNENYILYAFLSYNRCYETLLMNDYLVSRHEKLLLKTFNRVPNNNGGSLWIKKL